MQPSELIAFRAQHNLTRADLAKRLGLSPSTITRWESGKRRISPLLCAALEKITARQAAKGEQDV